MIEYIEVRPLVETNWSPLGRSLLARITQRGGGSWTRSYGMKFTCGSVSVHALGALPVHFGLLDREEDPWLRND